MPDEPSFPPFRERLVETSRIAPLVARLLWRASPGLLTAILLVLLLQALLPPLQLLLSRAVVDRAALDLGLATAADPLAARCSLASLILLTAAALSASQLLLPFSATLTSLASDRVTSYITEQLIRATDRWQGLERFEDPAFADDLKRARDNAATGGLTVAVQGASLVLALITAACVAVLLAGLHPLIPVLLVLASLPALARYGEFGTRTGSHLYWQTPDTRRLEYYREVLLTAEGAGDVRLYELAPYFRTRYDALVDRTAARLHLVRRRLRGGMMRADLLAGVAGGAVYLYLVWLVATGRRPIGDLVLFGGAATLLQMHLLDVGLGVADLPTWFGFLPSLFRVIDAPPDLPRAPRPVSAPRPIRSGFVFERVTFTYPGQSTPVLRDLSLTLRPGESVALVGRNGAGKTTLVKLLLRLYDPTAGRILLDGVDLRAYDLADLRREMGALFQDFVRYELTAGQNIGLGQIDALDDERQLESAAVRAGADELIRQLPDGFRTPLGRELGGRELSGGEWQKLALARACMRDCQLLVLDEPTASLDVQAEYEIYRRFHELTRGRMTLLISHRFSTVRMAQRILYLEDGSIREDGSHAELLARDGAYARLYRLQASQYAEPSHDRASA